VVSLYKLHIPSAAAASLFYLEIHGKEVEVSQQQTSSKKKRHVCHHKNIYGLVHKPEKTYVRIMRCQIKMLCEIYKYMVIGLEVRLEMDGCSKLYCKSENFLKISKNIILEINFRIKRV
jgi:hypothetical protein